MRHRRKIAIFAFTTLVVVAFVAVPPVWQRLCGNYNIELYGRVVDEQGRGLPGIRVEARFLYSPVPMVPSPSAGPEAMRFAAAETDANGNFRIGPAYGYAVDFESIKRDGRDIRAFLKRPIPDIGGHMNELSGRARIPLTPSRRVTFVLSS
jgi:hypothetical protein